MRDGVIQICLALINFFSVVIICAISGPPPTMAHGLIRAVLIMIYFMTLTYLNRGDDDDKNNKRDDDDVSDLSDDI